MRVRSCGKCGAAKKCEEEASKIAIIEASSINIHNFTTHNWKRKKERVNAPRS